MKFVLEALFMWEPFVHANWCVRWCLLAERKSKCGDGRTRIAISDYQLSMKEQDMSRSRPFSASALFVFLTATIAGCASIDSHGPEGGPADRTIMSNVETLLRKHPELGPPGAITVQTVNSIVYLNGHVDAGLEKRIAADVALQAAGMTKVVNGISVPHS
jgi:osmotically-inducible protein OsmY